MVTPHIKKGFTLIELLISISILAILVVIALSMVRSNRDKADDAATKADLQRLKIAFEDYYGDNNCYPPAEFFDSADDCGSNHLAPYLGSLPCDNTTDLPYVLETDATGCNWFKLYTNLKFADADPSAQSLCGSGGSSLGNYGVSSDNVALTVACTTAPTSSPASSGTGEQLPPGHDYYYCSALGNCTSFDSELFVCSPYYTDNPNCNGGPNPCQSVGSCTPL
jgi:prepilin-type N-terminal cleavage/methylation domain-containing protein